MMQSRTHHFNIGSRTGSAVADSILALGVLSIAIVISITGFRSVAGSMREQRRMHLAKLEIDHAQEVIASWDVNELDQSHLDAWLEVENRSLRSRELNLVCTLKQIHDPLEAREVALSVYAVRPESTNISSGSERPPLTLKTFWIALSSDDLPDARESSL